MDYPRDYIIPNQEIEVGTAFVVMPIRPEFDLPLGVITDVCNTLGIKARRADDIARQDFIMSNILDGIAKSEIVIVDITGNNPNVFYELGIAHTLRTRQTIIIITQDEDVSRSPFDIRHWSILQYDIKNIPLFRAALKEKIKDCRNYVDYEEYIFSLLKSYAFEGNLIHDFINYSKQICEKDLQFICNILIENTNPIQCDGYKLQNLYRKLTSIGDIKDGLFKRITWILKTLVYTSDFVLTKHIDTIKNMFLHKWQKDNMISMDDMDYWELVANICSKIIEKNYDGKIDAVQWMTSYLRNLRMGRIDRVRGKIEDFLMTVKDKDVDHAIIDLIKGDSLTARESAIDISGQKPIFESADILLQIINSQETSPYIIRSSINALARMKIKSAGPFILKWMENNRDKWGQQAVSATLRKVAEEALNELDQDSYTQLINLK